MRQTAIRRTNVPNFQKQWNWQSPICWSHHVTSDSSKDIAEDMLGKTYCWVTKEKPYRIVALITLANDSIKAHKLSSSTRNKVQRNISNAKRGRSYPAVLIGRIGVNEDFQGFHVGSQLLDFASQHKVCYLQSVSSRWVSRILKS